MRNINYPHVLLRVEALYQFDTLCAQVVSTTISHLNCIILGLGTYFFTVNVLSNKKHGMRRRMSNSRKLKLRQHAAYLIDINEYLDSFPE